MLQLIFNCTPHDFGHNDALAKAMVGMKYGSHLWCRSSSSANQRGLASLSWNA